MTSATPPDRGHIDTEQRHAAGRDLHTRDVAGIVAVMQAADAEIPAAMAAAAPALTALIAAIEPGFLRGGRVVYLGAGTSGRLGVLDASECGPTFQLPPGRIVGIIAGGDRCLRAPGEGAEDDPRGAIAELDALQLTADDAVIGIAAGGTTPYVRGALEMLATRTPAPLTGLITCARVATPEGVRHHVVIPTGPEILTGSTRLKAGTATKLALNTITTTLMIRAGRVHDGLMVDLRASNAKLVDRAARIIVSLTGLSRADALIVLERAAGQVKPAVLMARTGLDLAAAQARLAAHHGRLAEALADATTAPGIPP